MHAHSQYCWSGDNTLEATKLAIDSLAEEDCDEAIVVVLSDANLSRYGIPASKLTTTLLAHRNVNAYVIFIGSLGDQAEKYVFIHYRLTKNNICFFFYRLSQALPSGHSFLCQDVKTLPHILKQIFSSSVINI